MNANRRTAIKTTGALATLVSLGIVTPAQAQGAGRAGFEAKNIADALKAVGGAAAANDQVSIVSPDIAENGAVVPVGAVSKLPNTTEIHILVEKNPTPLVASFTVPAGTSHSLTPPGRWPVSWTRVPVRASKIAIRYRCWPRVTGSPNAAVVRSHRRTGRTSPTLAVMPVILRQSMFSWKGSASPRANSTKLVKRTSYSLRSSATTAVCPNSCSATCALSLGPPPWPHAGYTSSWRTTASTIS